MVGNKLLGLVELGSGAEEVILHSIEVNEMKGVGTPLSSTAILPSPTLLWRFKVSTPVMFFSHNHVSLINFHFIFLSCFIRGCCWISEGTFCSLCHFISALLSVLCFVFYVSVSFNPSLQESNQDMFRFFCFWYGVSVAVRSVHFSCFNLPVALLGIGDKRFVSIGFF